MSSEARECAEYFRSRPEFQRILEELRKKYQRYGRCAGIVCLEDATREECEAARSIFGRSFTPPLRFKTADFERSLQQTVFHDVSLREVLELYFGAEIQTRKQARQLRENQFSDLLRRLREQVTDDACLAWLDTLGESGSGAGSLIRRAAAEDPEQTERQVLQACQAVQLLHQQDTPAVRLAVLSARATTDPHALDGGTLSGKLFLYLLAFRAGREYPAGAEQRDRLYFDSGILCDSISSLVSQTGLILDLEQGEHPAYRLLRERHEICTLSLAVLTGLSGVRSPSGRVYIVENEMVFTQLCDQSAVFHSPLICTSGQPSVAALRLLDLLAADQTRLYYSGDFDGKGLSIAAQLWIRYPGLLRPWRLTPEDYAGCRSTVPLGEASRSLLQGCAGTALEDTAAAVEDGGYVGYQELLIPALEADLARPPEP